MKKLLLILLLWGCCLLAQAQNNQPQQKDFRILHANGVLNAPATTPLNTRQKNAIAGGITYQKEQYYLVQFEELPNNSLKEALAKSGITLLDYFPKYAYYAWFSRNIESKELSAWKIRAVLSIDRSFKLSPELFNNAIPSYALKGTQAELNLILYRKEDKAELLKAISGIASSISPEGTNEPYIKVTVDLNQLDALVNQKLIKYIEPIAAPAKMESDRNTHGRSNFLNSGYNNLSYNGTGINVNILEGDGVFPSIDFKGRLTSTISDVSANNHASEVAWNLGNAGNIDPNERNNAWGANIYSINSSDFIGLYDDPAKKIQITNISLGWALNNAYTSSQSVPADNFIRQKKQGMLVFSAGNDGGSAAVGGKYNGIAGWSNLSGPYKQAKNILVVGGLYSDDSMISWSMKGPAYDGRLKPELAIEGAGGTSFACPKVVGAMAILSEAYKTETSQSEATSGLIKAILMNTADDVGNPGIDFKTGYGRPNARRAYSSIKNRQFFIDSLATGNQKNHIISVPAGIKQLRVMLYWTDVPASPGAAQALVNDLDLQVKSPSNVVTLPWGLDTTANPINLDMLPTRKVDHLNNSEQVTIDDPVAGNYTANVNGFAVPQGVQEYYVVYELVKDEVVMEYPLGGESLIPGQVEYLRWGAGDYNGTFDLQYSADNGTTWNNITTGVVASGRGFQWTVPSISGKLIVRVKRGTQTSTSGVVSVFPIPQAVKILWACDNNTQVYWKPVPQATKYDIFRLGAKYMEQIASTTDTFYVAPTVANQEEWYAVRAIGPNGEVSMRSTPVQKPVGTTNCKGSVIVYLTSPATKTAYPEGVNIPINAQALNNNGTITKVEFLQGNIKIGEVQNTPYNFTWQNVLGSTGGGNYIITARAIGSNGDTARSAPINIWVSHSAPIAYFPFTNNTNDVSGYNRNAVNSGIAFQADTAIKSVVGALTGSQFADISTGDSAAANMPYRNITAACWVKVNTALSWGGFFGNLQDDGSTENGWLLGTRSNKFSFALRSQNKSSLTYLADPATFTTGKWYHVAGTYDGTTMKLYVNGQLKTSSTTQSGDIIYPVSGWFTIGHYKDSDEDYKHNGSLDEVKLWDRALTAQEITDLYTNTPPLTPLAISVTSPVSNSSFAEGTVVPVTVSTITNSSIAKVMYFWNNTKIGETLNSPYSFNWTIPGGTGNLTARVINITADTSISAPTNITGIHKDPILYYPFTNNMNDESGFNRNAVNSGITFQLDTVENSVVGKFTGAEYADISIGDTSAKNLPVKNMTAACWVKVNTALSYGGFLGNIQDNGSTENGWLLGTINNKFNIALRSANNLKLTYLTDTSTFVTKKWYHVAASYDGTTIKLYVNGRLKVSSVDQNGNIAYPANGWLTIGRYKDSDEDYRHKGSLDEIKLWERALTDQEILDLFNTPVPNIRPAIAIVSPANHSSFMAGDSIRIEATANDIDGTIAKVSLFRDTVKLGEALKGPYNFNLPNMAAGNYKLIAKAIDNRGEVDTATITIQVNNVLPSVALATPINNSNFNNEVIKLAANAYDKGGQVAVVEFYAGNTKIGEVNAAPYTMNWGPVSTGTYTVVAKATDDLHAQTTSQPITISVVNPHVCSDPDWNSNHAYKTGDRVNYDGFAFKASAENTGTSPKKNGHGVWEKIGPCGRGNEARKENLSNTKSNTDQENIKIFPNPTTGTLSVKIPESGAVEISIYNASGKLLRSEKINNSNKDGLIRLDISGYDKGIYYIPISVNNVKKAAMKIIKQ